MQEHLHKRRSILSHLIEAGRLLRPLVTWSCELCTFSLRADKLSGTVMPGGFRATFADQPATVKDSAFPAGMLSLPPVPTLQYLPIMGQWEFCPFQRWNFLLSSADSAVCRRSVQKSWAVLYPSFISMRFLLRCSGLDRLSILLYLCLVCIANSHQGLKTSVLALTTWNSEEWKQLK